MPVGLALRPAAAVRCVTCFGGDGDGDALTRSRPMCGADRGTAARIIRAATLLALALAHGASSGFRLNARQLDWGQGTERSEQPAAAPWRLHGFS